MRLIFMGTPDFAVPTLAALLDAGHEVAAVYTQPDKEKGRGKKVEYSAVKTYALSRGLTVLQPEKLRGNAVYEELRQFQAEAIIVVAYGQILRKTVLEMTKYGCFNVHASLLPKYRGAAPIQWAVINGEKTTGVTIMQMDAGLDTGDILNTAEIQLAPDETGDSLFEKLSVMGGPLLLETLKQAEEGTLHPIPQGEAVGMYAKMLDKKMGLLDFTKNASEIDCLIRGLNSWPSAYTYLNGKMLKIWSAETCGGEENETPGTVIRVTKKDFTVQCGDNTAITVLSIQPEGKKRMDTDAYLRGYPMETGTVLG